MTDNYLKELAQTENEERLARKRRADDATEEWLFRRLKASKEGTPAPSVLAIAAQYGVTKGMIEHRVNSLRYYYAAHKDDADPMLSFLAEILQGMAEVQARKKGK